jgi:hypothetical protein
LCVRTDRRAHERVPESVPALFVRDLGASDVWSGRVVNLSEGGACLLTEQPVTPGTELYVGLFLEGLGGLPLITMGTVVWSRPAEGTLGLAFVRAGAAQRHAIEQLREHLARRRRELVGAR